MSLIDEELKELLTRLRARRGFDANTFVRAKARLLNDYMRQSGLKSVVVGVSGGVDSALVLAILVEAKRQQGSPIERILAALLPYFIESGTTNQSAATTRGVEVAAAFECQPVLIDLSSSHEAMKGAADKAFGQEGDAWAAGQLVSYLRTPALFYLTSLLTQQGLPGILMGTTNRDEGGYIGYFGKAADAMVDLQLISDIHKSEVYAAARLLNVPASALEAEPTGDIYDGRTDEQLIGVPYDFIELYSLYLSQLDRSEQDRLQNRMGAVAREQFSALAERLQTLNRQNAHKYIAGSTAVHLDVYERAVPGGWRVEPHPDEAQRAIDRSKFVNQFEIPDHLIEELEQHTIPPPAKRLEIKDFGDSAFIVQNLLSEREVLKLTEHLKEQTWVPVGVHGMLKDFNPDTDAIGSWRASHYSEPLAAEIWRRMAPAIPMVRIMSAMTPTDWNGDPVWRAIGINPLFRFIRYTDQGLLVPHYDGPYDYREGKRTLVSVVIYLTESADDEGGRTRFIVDPQRHLPFEERVFADWTRLARVGEILTTITPKLGAALILDHRILHDSEPVRGQRGKIIMRTDIVFERCGLSHPRQLSVSRPLGLLDQHLSQIETKSQSDREASSGTADSGKNHGEVSSNGARGPGRNAVLPTKAVAGSDEEALHRAMLDPLYGPAFPLLGSVEALYEAGFFDDGTREAKDSESRADNDWLMTPTHKIREKLAALPDDTGDKWLAVLVSTGGFCPIHQGHIEMMEIARRHLETQGAIVVGGYLSPSHDDYVSIKCGPAALDALQRMRLCEQLVLNSDWLMVDGWEALGVERALNFSEVIERLQLYLSKHIHTQRAVQVVYVYGSDNARFAPAFAARGRCVCVMRPGFEEPFNRYSSRFAGSDRVFFAPEESRHICSTDVRLAAAPESERLELVTSEQREALPMTYYLRNEQDWVLDPWLAGRNKAALQAAWHKFRSGLKELLVKVHARAVKPDQSFLISIDELEITAQSLRAAELLKGERVISLDPCIPGDFDLGISRRFPLSAGLSFPEVVMRPGSADLSSQIEAISPGQYVLFDDDIASGTTMARLTELLPSHINVVRVCALTRRGIPETQDLMDIADSRDFLPGSRQGGLVVAVPNGAGARAPYCLPYVSPSARASTPVSSDLEFSLSIWRLSEEFFQSVRPAITLEQCEPAFQELMIYIGFSESSTMVEICGWHVQRLEQLIKPVAAACESISKHG